MDFYRTVLRPGLFALSAEGAHDLALVGLGIASRSPALCAWLAGRHAVADPRLEQTVWGRRFRAPVGLAAGLDKNAVGIEALAACGFSHVEVGTVTGQGQPGNPKPRLFRLKADEGIINRMGFNNGGAAAMAARLTARFDVAGGKRRPGVPLGINLGKSKVVDNDAALADYQASIAAVGRFADYLVINVSSPNTPGLRDLQAEAALRPLLAGVRSAVDALVPGCPLLLKIAPDLSEAGIDSAVDVALETGCDGVICTNTTIGRNGLRESAERVASLGAGGLSGRPVRSLSTQVLGRVARRIAAGPRKIPVIGVGGVDHPDVAWEKICHGATLVQVYSALIYHGPGLVPALHRGLAAHLDRTGLGSIAAAIGRDL